jgi:putative ABC transport system permease protein
MMVDSTGRPIGTGAIATTGLSTHVNPDLASAVSYAGGRAPSGPDEVAIDAATAAKRHVAVGDRIRILFTGPPGTFTVVGVARFGGVDSLGGGTAALFDTATAQQVLGRIGGYDSIDALAGDGIEPAALADRIGRVLPAGSRPRPGRPRPPKARSGSRTP